MYEIREVNSVLTGRKGSNSQLKKMSMICIRTLLSSTKYIVEMCTMYFKIIAFAKVRSSQFSKLVFKNNYFFYFLKECSKTIK